MVRLHREVGPGCRDHHLLPAGGRILRWPSRLFCCVPCLDSTLPAQSPAVFMEPCFSVLFSSGLSWLSRAALVCPRVCVHGGRAKVSVTWPSEACQELDQDVLTLTLLDSAPGRTLGCSERLVAGVGIPASRIVLTFGGRGGSASRGGCTGAWTVGIFDFLSWIIDTQVFLVSSFLLPCVLSIS